MDLRSARELYSVSLGLATKVLGHNHPATAVHASKLGIVLQVRRRVGSCFCPPPCPGSPFTPFPCHGLFANVQRLGDHDRAAEMLERVLFIHENVLQVRCPGAIWSVVLLALPLPLPLIPGLRWHRWHHR